MWRAPQVISCSFFGRFFLGAANGGEDAHEAEVGKEPREEDGEAQEGAELDKELEVAGEQGQRRLQYLANTRGKSVPWRRVLRQRSPGYLLARHHGCVREVD